ncbi:Mitochondrial carrier-like protein [Brazilian cedratvirus IHUMI]|uniref:Mitochondrial carrier-like protein n=1 Tax=Brazilian cedratvirus IHUMI TaxID=2126980 RepID=A0A2R8FFA0_9VIRU|nr:Mitochondrial carrier-like protein [Brazilian cedratvirus IHUMI]
MEHIVACIIASSVAEITTLPICTLKTNLQNKSQRSIPHIIKSIYRKHGIRGFYNSSLWAVSSQVFSTTSKYYLYRRLQENVPNRFLAGGLSGLLASLLTHPLDVIKVHAQMHKSFCKQLYEVGPKIFYRGYSKTLSKSTLGSVLYLPLFDLFDQRLQNPALSSVCSAIISCTLLQPLDYMKTRQVFGKDVPPLYFRGLSLNLLRVVPHFCITMSLIKLIEGN